MLNPSKVLGVVIGVDGDVSQVGMYNMSNDSQHLWYGDILTGPKIGAFLTINQNDIKIIATVSSEKIMDQQNTVKSAQFDNRFHKNSINRIIFLKTKGIIENGKFYVTSQYVPMVGNEITLTTKVELDVIYGLEAGEPSIYVGKSILENQTINIPINRFFASHIGIFGNTGSGKSNTLHKLYFQLFQTEYYPKIERGSQFFIIDFNGEYVGELSFGLNAENKENFEIVTGNDNQGKKLPVKKEYLFDADILSILFDARPATQVPFLRNAMRIWDQSDFDGEKISNFVIGTIKKILTTGDSASSDAKDNWIKIASQYVGEKTLLTNLEELDYLSNLKNYRYNNQGNFVYINDKSAVSEDTTDYLKLNEIKAKLKQYFEEANELEKLKMHLEFQKIHQSAWKSTNIEYLNPLFNRINSSFSSLAKVIDVVEDISDKYKTVNIISLVHANQEITRLIPMLISKMIYDEQKKSVAGRECAQTKHLIVDEAHNILNNEYRNNGDDWQDYRLSVFEEIVKEGRKFGFYLTLSSQRPADISPTILSQIHNYFIHRLVNEKDLRMLENTMPTLDKNSYNIIPSLGQGEVIITGSAMSVPVFVKIAKEKIRPNSDDVTLTDLWNKL